MTTQPAQRVWTPDDVLALGVRTDIPTAGEILAGLTRTQSYELYKVGRFPVPVIKCGRRLVVPVAPILRLLDIGPPGMDEAEPATGPATVTAITADPRPRSTALEQRTARRQPA